MGKLLLKALLKKIYKIDKTRGRISRSETLEKSFIRRKRLFLIRAPSKYSNIYQTETVTVKPTHPLPKAAKCLSMSVRIFSDILLQTDLAAAADDDFLFMWLFAKISVKFHSGVRDEV